MTPHHRYGVAFWSKPPLSIWLTASSYLALGVNEFAARLASLVPCLAVAGIVFNLAARRGSRDVALRATVVLLTTPIFFVSAGAVMTDPALILGTTLSMAGFWHAMAREDRIGRVWGYLFFVGLAIGLLAKGPVGVVLTLAPVGVWTLWKGGIGNVWRRLPWISGACFSRSCWRSRGICWRRRARPDSSITSSSASIGSATLRAGGRATCSAPRTRGRAA